MWWLKVFNMISKTNFSQKQNYVELKICLSSSDFAFDQSRKKTIRIERVPYEINFLRSQKF